MIRRPTITATSSKLEAYRQAALRGAAWLAGQLRPDGSFGPEVADLASYYKSPQAFLTAGRADLAYRVLGHVERTFLRADGDVTTAPRSSRGETGTTFKSEDPPLAEYYPYMNAWIAIGAQKLGRFDVVRRVYPFVRSFFHELHGGFIIHAPAGQGDDVTGAFITSHLGLAALYCGEPERARRAGDYLLRLLDLQPDLDHGLYLRRDAGGDLITDFPEEQAPFHVVRAREPFQLYFFVGYPIAYLARLAEATGEGAYLDGARAYLDFARGADDSLYRFHFSHKVAWAASIVARLTGDARARDTATRITDYLVSIQDSSGGWLAEEPATTRFDQSAEIVTWMLEICAELGARPSSSGEAEA